MHPRFYEVCYGRQSGNYTQPSNVMTSSKERPSAEREGSRLLHREVTDGLLRPHQCPREREMYISCISDWHVCAGRPPDLCDPVPDVLQQCCTGLPPVRFAECAAVIYKWFSFPGRRGYSFTAVAGQRLSRRQLQLTGAPGQTGSFEYSND